MPCYISQGFLPIMICDMRVLVLTGSILSSSPRRAENTPAWEAWACRSLYENFPSLCVLSRRDKVLFTGFKKFISL